MITFNSVANWLVKQLAVHGLARQLNYGPADTALVLVGTQPDLLCEPFIVANLGQLIKNTRAARVPIVFSPAAPPTAEHGIAHPTPSQLSLLADSLLSPGSAAAQIHPRLGPAADDIVLAPRARLSAFAGTDLAMQLAGLGVQRVVVAGARTDIEIDSTARDAVEFGLQTTIIADCCAGTSPAAHDESIKVTLPRVIHGILTAKEFTRKVNHGRG